MRGPEEPLRSDIKPIKAHVGNKGLDASCRLSESGGRDTCN